MEGDLCIVICVLKRGRGRKGGKSKKGVGGRGKFLTSKNERKGNFAKKKILGARKISRFSTSSRKSRKSTSRNILGQSSACSAKKYKKYKNANSS